MQFARNGKDKHGKEAKKQTRKKWYLRSIVHCVEDRRRVSPSQSCHCREKDVGGLGTGIYQRHAMTAL